MWWNTHINYMTKYVKNVGKVPLMQGVYGPKTPVTCQPKALIFGTYKNNILIFSQMKPAYSTGHLTVTADLPIKKEIHLSLSKG